MHDTTHVTNKLTRHFSFKETSKPELTYFLTRHMKTPISINTIQLLQVPDLRTHIVSYAKVFFLRKTFSN